MEFVPGGQRWHTVDPAKEYVPAAHDLHIVFELAPDCKPYVPARHKLQNCCLKESVYVPGVHNAHDKLPNNDELVPGTQKLQEDSSAAPVLLLNVPTGHGRHTLGDAPATVELNVPDGHNVHFEAPGVSL